MLINQGNSQRHTENSSAGAQDLGWTIQTHREVRTQLPKHSQTRVANVINMIAGLPSCLTSHTHAGAIDIQLSFTQLSLTLCPYAQTYKQTLIQVLNTSQVSITTAGGQE